MKQLFYLFFLLISNCIWSQTTDLSASIEVTNLSGSSMSNVVLFEDFYYVTTISNSANGVSNSTFYQEFNADVTVLSYESINAVGNSDLAINFGYDNIAKYHYCIITQYAIGF